MSSKLLIATLLAAAGLAAAGCAKEQPEAAPARLVRTVVVSASSGGSATRYTAEIRSRYETDLSFQVSGKIISRPVDVGTTVRKGTVLAQLDETDQRTGVDAARAAVNAARAEVARARSDEARYRDLLERGLTTRANYMAQETAAKTAQSKLEQSLADLRLNEQRQSYTTLRANADGIVTEALAEVGSVVAAGQHVLTLAQPSELEAVFDIPDSRVDDVRTAPGIQIAMLNTPQALYPARVREISPSADPVTRTYRVKTTLITPPAGLRLGMTVTVSLPQSSGNARVSLPATALFQKERNTAVWVVKPDNTLELRTVDVERYESNRVVLSGGLNNGERVVTAGVHKLTAGETVRLLEGAK